MAQTETKGLHYLGFNIDWVKAFGFQSDRRISFPITRSFYFPIFRCLWPGFCYGQYVIFFMYLVITHHALVNCVPSRDRGPGGISSEDFPSQARSACALNAIVCYHTEKCQAIGVRPSRSSFKSSLETQTEKVELPSTQNLQPANAQRYDHSGTTPSKSPSRATDHKLAQTE